MGYFAYAQYDVLFLYVILNDSEESHRRTDGYMYFFTLVVGYFACAQYDVFFIPYRHFVPLPPKEEAKLHVILNAVKNPTEELTSIYFITLVVGYFAYAQYDVKSPIGDYAAHFTHGDRHADCYSALNACALKLSFFAFFIKNASAL